MIDVKIYGLKGLQEKTISSKKALQIEIIKNMNKSLMFIVRDAKINVTEKLNRTRMQGYKRPTGRLRNSIIAKPIEVYAEGKIIGRVGVVGSDGKPLVYAAVHEFGHKFKAPTKTGGKQAYAIPLPPGTSESAEQLYRAGKTFMLNSGKSGVPITSKSGRGAGGAMYQKGIVFLKAQYAGGRPRPIFALRRFMDVPARPYLKPAYLKNKSLIIKLLGESFKAVYSRGKGIE